MYGENIFVILLSSYSFRSWGGTGWEWWCSSGAKPTMEAHVSSHAAARTAPSV